MTVCAAAPSPSSPDRGVIAPCPDPVTAAIAQVRRGGMVVLVGTDADAQSGDLVLAAGEATPAGVNFMATRARGLICASISQERAERLGIASPASGATAFAGVDLRDMTAGISASARAGTLRALADPASVASDFVTPGHVPPLVARDGRIIERVEAAVELMRLADLAPAAAICEIVDEHGEPAGPPALARFAADHGLPLLTIDDLVGGLRSVPRVEREIEAVMPTPYGTCRAVGYRELGCDIEHVAFVFGDLSTAPPPTASIHAECTAGHVFRSHDCGCGARLDASLERIAEIGRGVVVYVRDRDDLRMFDHLRDSGAPHGDRVDARTVALGAAMLRDLGVADIRLLSDDATAADAFSRNGVSVCERLAPARVDLAA